MLLLKNVSSVVRGSRVDELGQTLRQARLEKGLTLEEISKITKIRTRYLQAIEDGKYELLPGYAYTRGFIKSYAETVGLSPEECLKQYRPPESEIELYEPLPPRAARSRAYHLKPKPSFLTKGFTFLLFVLFLVLIGMVLYWFISTQMSKDTGHTLPSDSLNEIGVEQGSPSGTPLSPVEEEKPEPGNPAEEEPQSEPPAPEPALELVEKGRTTDVYLLSNVSVPDVVLSFTGNCWVQVRAGDERGTVLYSGELKSGDVWRLSDVWDHWEEGAEGLFVRLGRPQSAEIRANGLMVETASYKSSPHNFVIRWALADTP